MLFSHLAKTGLGLLAKRFAGRTVCKSWPNDWVPIHWNRPEKEPGYKDPSDLEPLSLPNSEDILPDYSYSKELRKLDPKDPLRRIFSLENAKRSQQQKFYVKQHYDRLGLFHQIYYTNSLEAKIINLTFTLRQIQERIESKGGSTRYNGYHRQAANNVKYRRYRYLCDLKEIHGDRWKRLIKALNIEPKENPINVPYERPYRKIQMRRLALEYASDLKEKKVEEFMKSLETEKAAFEEEKKETLKWIEEQEKLLQTI